MRAWILIAGLLWAATGWANGAQVSDAWVRYIAGGPSAAYFSLTNSGPQPTRLVGARCPAFDKVMLHRSVEKEGQARMVHVDGVTVEPGDTFDFAPGGYHVMLMQPNRSMEIGSTVPVTLRFADGTERTVDFAVAPPYRQKAPE